MPTIIGMIFLAAGALCLTLGEQWLLGLLVFSSFFQAASAINFGSSGIQPYYLIACILIVSQMRKLEFWRSNIHFEGKWILVAFGSIGLLSSLICPFLFAGLPVYSPSIGIDDSFIYQPPLHFGLSNLAQAVYLVTNLLTVRSAALVIETQLVRRLYTAAFGLLVSLVCVQFILLQFGVQFPNEIFQNNPGYAIAIHAYAQPSSRVVGTFTEASEAGLCLVMFFAGYFYEFFAGKRSFTGALVAAAALFMVRSSAAMAAMIVVIVLVCAVYFFYKPPWTIRTDRLMKLVALLIIAGVIALSPIASLLSNYTVEKSDTLSYLHRTAADLFALRLAADTHWVGVGLGSNRPSSLITSLLSNIGVLGTLVFSVLVIQLARNARGSDTWIRWSVAAGVIDMCIGVPDINQPLLWVFLSLAAHYGACSQSPERSAVPQRLGNAASEFS
jgi:hypothetical protein